MERKRKVNEKNFQFLLYLCRTQEHRCALCGQVMELPSTRKKIGPRTATREHIVPKSKGGLNWKTNEVAAHSECNQKRGNAPLDPIQAARVAFILDSRKCTKEADRLLESFRQKKEGQ